MQVDGNCDKKKPTIEAIREKLIIKRFTIEEFRPQILIQFLIHNEEKYDFIINKSVDILSKLVADQYESIIEDKISKET